MSKCKEIFVANIGEDCYMLLTKKKSNGELVSALINYNGDDLKDASIENTSLTVISSQNIMDLLQAVAKQLEKLNLGPMSFTPMTDRELWHLNDILHLNDYLYWFLNEAGEYPDKDSYKPHTFPLLKTITLGEIVDYTNMSEHMTVDITDILDEAKRADKAYKLEKLDIIKLYSKVFDYVEKLVINPNFIVQLTQLIRQYESGFSEISEIVDYKNLE